jgi:hypothetical protein
VTDVEVTAWVDNPTPIQNSVVTVFGRIIVDGRPKGGVRMDTTWHYRTKDSGCSGMTDVKGEASCSRRISMATVGYTVRIEVDFTYERKVYRTETSFTLR